LGRDLYEAFFEGYTLKQWGCSPTELPASILKRLPVRFNYNDSYYNSRHQGMPVDGYTSVIESILDHPQISVELGREWNEAMKEEHDHVFFTGPIDQFFGYSEGRLAYRTVFWERKEAEGDYQGNAVINYPEKDVPYTRVHEHKHFAPWEEHEKTVVFTEFSKETEEGDIPYYPKRLAVDMKLYESYRERAQKASGVSFLGRLATYRYMDMHQVIGEAMDFSTKVLEAEEGGQDWPLFSGE
jgi:UDP-galactopyranose mutase